MNGIIQLPLTRSKYFLVGGGSYAHRPAGMYGVNLTTNPRLFADIFLPTKDFGVPTQKEAQLAVRKAVPLILKGCPVYVGCYMGYGRTGMFLALLAKSFGVENPVGYVRSNYATRAVETLGQEAFVKMFKVPLIVRLQIKMAVVRYLFSSRNRITPLYPFGALTKQD